MSKISRAINQVRQAFFGIIARAGAKAQITGNDGEVLDEMEIIQQVGFSSWIPEGSRVVIIPLLGKSSRSVIVGSTEAPVMITVSEGETCIYDQFGHQILLTGSGVKIKGSVQTDQNFDVATGATGTFTSAMGQIITVANGIIVGIG
ncbi:phage baseplate assembly protein domain-containing protein [Acinetobacter sp. TR11]|uniref:phage baseplate assembly protein domain-containing protein n=1 Tax=Acinetobacter sp. TR11 TaxID=3003393 RepID=UPI0022ABD2BF|nr:phage baseplate assembly protein [Acinetobacter sp. TR11]WAU72907.1 phage baseplate assembly protein [Acinetobacter sp. TR11]